MAAQRKPREASSGRPVERKAPEVVCPVPNTAAQKSPQVLARQAQASGSP